MAVGTKHSLDVAAYGGTSSRTLAPKNHLKVFDSMGFEQTVELTRSEPQAGAQARH